MATIIDPDLPTAAPALMPALSRTHDLVRFTPDGNPALEFEVVIPKGWAIVRRMGPVPEGFAQPRPIGHFRAGLAPESASVTVTVTSLPIEVNLEDWTQFILADQGWRVFASRWRQTPGGAVADVGAIRGADAEREVMRTMTLANNGRVFMVSGLAREGVWNRWKYELLVACASFKLLRPSSSDSLEALVEWEGGSPRFGVTFPASWQAEEKRSERVGKSAVDLRLTMEDKLLSYLRVKATDLALHHTSVDARLEEAVRELVTSGFSPTAPRDWPVPDALGALIVGYDGTAVVPGRMWDQDVEARIGLRSVGGGGFTTTLIAPSRGSNILLWMRGKRAFEIVRALCWTSPVAVG